MSVVAKSCYICSDDETKPPVYLPDKSPVFVGRSIDTKITDTKCSRQQVWLYANYTDHRVIVKQVGSHSSGLNGFKTQKDTKVVAKHGDQLEILYNKYFYQIQFNPPPAQSSGNSVTKTREHDSGSDIEEKDPDDPRMNKKCKLNIKDGDEGALENAEGDEKDYGAAGTLGNLEADGKNHGAEDERERHREMKMTNDGASGWEDVAAQGCSSKMEPTESSRISDAAKPTENALWEEIDNKAMLIYTSKGVESRSKIAAYDMDGTLIKTRSGLVFPKDNSDWQILFPEVPGKLKKLHNEGYKIVIFTNQGALGLGKVKPSDFKLKIERVVQKLGVPMQVFIAVAKGMYRKPLTGMWDALVNNKNDGIEVKKSSSFFVGDAAGRQKNWAPKKKKDHSIADRLLALNLALKFETPEEHFLGHKKAPYELPSFDPKCLDDGGCITEPPNAKLTSNEQEVILLVGGPGSGKSHVAKTHLAAYQRINRDTLGSWQKCVSFMDQALSQGKSVVVDNTNPDPASRQKYIEVAKVHKVPVRCFVMTTGSEHAKHNNKFRQLTDSAHDTISDVIINSYTATKSQLVWRCVRFVKLLLLLTLHLYAQFFNSLPSYRKNFKPPRSEEGFSEIVRVNFVPRFRNDEHKKLYEMYLLEK